MPEPMMSAPLSADGGAWALLRPKFQMARHRARHHERGDIRRLLVVSVVALGFWSAAFVIALRLLRYFRSAEDIGQLLAAKLLAMILLSFGTILLLSNTIAALSNFFLARDLDQLAAAPARSIAPGCRRRRCIRAGWWRCCWCRSWRRTVWPIAAARPFRCSPCWYSCHSSASRRPSARRSRCCW
jgi:hypothetical protein